MNVTYSNSKGVQLKTKKSASIATGISKDVNTPTPQKKIKQILSHSEDHNLGDKSEPDLHSGKMKKLF